MNTSYMKGGAVQIIKDIHKAFHRHTSCRSHTHTQAQLTLSRYRTVQFKIPRARREVSSFTLDSLK